MHTLIHQNWVAILAVVDSVDPVPDTSLLSQRLEEASLEVGGLLWLRTGLRYMQYEL